MSLVGQHVIITGDVPEPAKGFLFTVDGIFGDILKLRGPGTKMVQKKDVEVVHLKLANKLFAGDLVTVTHFQHMLHEVSDTTTGYSIRVNLKMMSQGSYSLPHRVIPNCLWLVKSGPDRLLGEYKHLIGSLKRTCRSARDAIGDCPYCFHDVLNQLDEYPLLTLEQRRVMHWEKEVAILKGKELQVMQLLPTIAARRVPQERVKVTVNSDGDDFHIATHGRTIGELKKLLFGRSSTSYCAYANDTIQHDDSPILYPHITYQTLVGSHYRIRELQEPVHVKVRGALSTQFRLEMHWEIHHVIYEFYRQGLYQNCSGLELYHKGVRVGILQRLAEFDDCTFDVVDSLQYHTI